MLSPEKATLATALAKGTPFYKLIMSKCGRFIPVSTYSRLLDVGVPGDITLEALVERDGLRVNIQLRCDKGNRVIFEAGGAALGHRVINASTVSLWTSI